MGARERVEPVRQAVRGAGLRGHARAGWCRAVARARAAFRLMPEVRGDGFGQEVVDLPEALRRGRRDWYDQAAERPLH